MIGRFTIGDPGMAASPESFLIEEDAMWPANRGALRFARHQEDNQTAEPVVGKLHQQAVNGGRDQVTPQGTALTLYAL